MSCQQVQASKKVMKVDSLPSNHHLIKLAKEIRSIYEEYKGKKSLNKHKWRNMFIEPEPFGCNWLRLNKPLVYEKLLSAGRLASEVLNEHGFKVVKEPSAKQMTVEIQYANSVGNKMLNSPFSIYRNNSNYGNHKVHSLEIYLETEGVGGEFNLYNIYENCEFKLEKQYSVHSNYDESAIIMYDGELWHNQSFIKGGRLVMISFDILREQ